MKEFVQETVSKRFQKLPEEVRDTILSDDVTNALANAMRTAQLTEEQTQSCNQQATLVAVGLSTSKDFEEYVKKNLSLDDTAVTKLLEDVNAHVFSLVRNSLMQVLQTRKSEDKKNDQQKNGVGEKKEQTVDPYREPVA